MSKFNSFSHFRPDTEKPTFLPSELLVRRAEFALKTGEYLDAKADALLVINLPNEQRATPAQFSRALIVLLHAQSATTNIPSLGEEGVPPAHLVVHECNLVAGMAYLFATNPRNKPEERCAVHLGLARYYQYLNWQKQELASLTEVFSLCAELGEEGGAILREIYAEWPSLVP